MITREDFKITLESLLKKAQELKERKTTAEKESEESSERKIQLEVINEYKIPEINQLGWFVNSIILTYNKFPEKFTSLTNEDILQAQLVFDQYLGILHSAGITITNNEVRIFFCKDCPINEGRSCGPWYEADEIFQRCQDIHGKHDGWAIATEQDLKKLRGELN